MTTLWRKTLRQSAEEQRKSLEMHRERGGGVSERRHVLRLAAELSGDGGAKTRAGRRRKTMN